MEVIVQLNSVFDNHTPTYTADQLVPKLKQVDLGLLDMWAMKPVSIRPITMRKKKRLRRKMKNNQHGK